MRPPAGSTALSRRTAKGAILAAAAVGLVFAAGPAHGIKCTITSVSPVAFPAYDVFKASPTDAQGSVTYRCEQAKGKELVTIELSTGGAGVFNPRQMRRATEPLACNLFLDAGRATIWGDGSGGTAIYGPFDPPDKTSIVVPIFGRIPPGQNVSPGAYTDSVVLTLNF